MAYLPVFLARLGASTAQVSLLPSGPAIVNMLVLIPAGLLAERHPDQVRLCVRALLLHRLPYLILMLAPMLIEPSGLISATVVLWGLGTLGMAVAIPAWMTIISAAIPPERRARVNSVLWALLSLVGAALGPLFGWMLDRIAFPLNYQILFGLSLVGGLLDLYAFSHVRVASLEVKQRASSMLGGPVAQVRDGVRSYLASITGTRAFTRYLLATLALRIVFLMPSALYSLYWVNELGASDTWIGLRGTTACGALVLGYVVWGRIASRIKHRWVLALATFSLGLYPIATALIRSPSWLPVVAVIRGIAWSGVNVALLDLLLAAVLRERMPRMSSVHTMVASAIGFLGPLLGAAPSDATSLRTALLIVGTLQLLSIVTLRMLPSDV